MLLHYPSGKTESEDGKGFYSKKLADCAGLVIFVNVESFRFYALVEYFHSRIHFEQNKSKKTPTELNAIVSQKSRNEKGKVPKIKRK